MDCSPPGFSVHGILQARILECVAFPFFRGSSQTRDWTQVSLTSGRFFTSWETGKPKNAGVGGLSLLQGTFLSQVSNQGLLHCRQILYQLSYQGSPVYLWGPHTGMLRSSWGRRWVAGAVGGVSAQVMAMMQVSHQYPISTPGRVAEARKLRFWGSWESQCW